METTLNPAPGLTATITGRREVPRQHSENGNWHTQQEADRLPQDDEEIAFEAYDCKDPRSRSTPIDLTEVEDCDATNRHRTWKKPLQMSVTIVQQPTSTVLEAKRCHMTYVKQTCRCGFNSLHYGCTSSGKQTWQLTRSQCQGLWNPTLRPSLPKISEWYPRIPMKAFPHGQWSMVFFTRGNLSNGICENDNWKENGQTYENSYQFVTLQLTMEPVTGTYSFEDHSIRIRGMKAVYADRGLVDAIQGTIFWGQNIPTTCEEKAATIYTGMAKVYHPTVNQKNRQLNTRSIAIIADKEKKQYGAVMLKERHPICGVHDCYRTQTEHIFVCLRAQVRFNFSSAQDLELPNLDMATRINSGLITQALHTDDFAGQVNRALCQVDTEAQHGKLQAISGTGNPHALIQLFGVGHMVTAAGAVAYLTRCAPVEVRFNRQYPNCTVNIPVEVQRRNLTQRAFVNPLTMILQPTTAALPCSPLQMNMIKLGGQWYNMLPGELQPAPLRPLKLQTGKWQLSAEYSTNLDQDYGMFAPEVLEQHAQYMDTVLNREPIQAQIATTITSVVHRHPDRPLANLMPQMDPEQFTEALLNQYFPFLHTLGEAYNYIMGVLMLFAIVRVLLDSTLRTAAIIRVRGCGCHLISALCEGAYKATMLPFTYMKNAMLEVSTGQTLRPLDQRIHDEVVVLRADVNEIRAGMAMSRIGRVRSEPRLAQTLANIDPRGQPMNHVRESAHRVNIDRILRETTTARTGVHDNTWPNPYKDLSRQVHEERKHLDDDDQWEDVSDTESVAHGPYRRDRDPDTISNASEQSLLYKLGRSASKMSRSASQASLTALSVAGRATRKTGKGLHKVGKKIGKRLEREAKKQKDKLFQDGEKQMIQGLRSVKEKSDRKPTGNNKKTTHRDARARQGDRASQRVHSRQRSRSRQGRRPQSRQRSRSRQRSTSRYRPSAPRPQSRNRSRSTTRRANGTRSRSTARTQPRAASRYRSGSRQRSKR